MPDYKSAIPSASGVSAWLHSADPHLRRTKRSLEGVHATKVQFKGIRQGESRLVACRSLLSRPLLKLFSAPSRSVCPVCLFIIRELVKGPKGSELNVRHIYGNMALLHNENDLYLFPQQLKSSHWTWQPHSLFPNDGQSHVFMFGHMLLQASLIAPRARCTSLTSNTFEFYEQFIHNLSRLWCYCFCFLF